MNCVPTSIDLESLCVCGIHVKLERGVRITYNSRLYLEVQLLSESGTVEAKAEACNEMMNSGCTAKGLNLQSTFWTSLSKGKQASGSLNMGWFAETIAAYFPTEPESASMYAIRYCLVEA